MIENYIIGALTVIELHPFLLILTLKGGRDSVYGK